MDGHWRMFSLSMAAVTGFFAAAQLPPFVWAVAAAALILLILLLPKHSRAGVWQFAIVCAIAVSYFFVYDHLHASALKPLAEQAQQVTLDGQIASSLKRDGDLVQCFLRITSEPYAGETVLARITLSEEEQVEAVSAWQEANLLHGQMTLAIPERARNPHGFDYGDYLRWQGVTVIAKAGFDQVSVRPGNRSVEAQFHRLQEAAAKRIDTLFSDADTAGFLKSLLLGVADGPSPEVAAMYSDLGLIHVLAISGLHVTLVSGFCSLLLRKVGLPKAKALWLTMALVAFYVMLVGASGSAVRAGLMSGLYLWGSYAGHRFRVRDLWSLALMLMLAINPYQLWHLGFQLSFAVTLGLIEFVPLLMSIRISKFEWLRSSLAVTTAAQFVSFPFLIYYFHQNSPMSWPVNLLFVPVLSIGVLPLGYVALLLGTIHPSLAVLPANVITWLVTFVHGLLEQIHSIRVPFSFWPHPSWYWLAGYAIFLVTVLVCWRRGYHRGKDMVIYILCFALFMIWARQPFDGNGQVRITFLDVGQGDSAVVEIGHSLVYVIDSGGVVQFAEKAEWKKRRKPFEVGRDTLLPFLRSRGIERVERIVMTHGDLDHIGGFSGWLPRVSVGAALVNGKPPEGKEKELIEMVKERNAPVYTGTSQSSWTDAPGVRWTWLHPDKQDGLRDNDASVVLLLTAYGVNILFTGDLEANGEGILLERDLLPPIDVLKVAHHGSKSSTTQAFLDRIQPKLAVISVGRNNRYGHPAPDVLRRLEHAGVTILRTDRDGAVTLTVDRDGMKWKTEIVD